MQDSLGAFRENKILHENTLGTFQSALPESIHNKSRGICQSFLFTLCAASRWHTISTYKPEVQEVNEALG